MTKNNMSFIARHGVIEFIRRAHNAGDTFAEIADAITGNSENITTEKLHTIIDDMNAAHKKLVMERQENSKNRHVDTGWDDEILKLAKLYNY